MHVALLTAYFPPDVGSAAHLFYDLGRAFVEQGCDVSVVTGFPSYHAQGDLTAYARGWRLRETLAGMQVYRVRIPQPGRHTPMGRGVWQFNSALGLATAGFGRLRPDVTLVYSPPLPLGLSALVWRWRQGTPFVLNVQDLFPQSAVDLGVLRGRRLIHLLESLERFLYRQADGVTVHSSGNQAHVASRGGRPGRVQVMPNVVDTQHLQPGPKHNRLRAELQLHDRFIVSFAGVMGYSQDLDVVLAAAQLVADEPAIHFLLVGDGVEKARLMRHSAALGLHNVTWLPMQPRERYPAILHASDVGLATLHADVRTPVVPSKIISIMAAGRPVVAALDLQGDAPRLLAEAQAGFCLPPEDAPALAARLLQLYRDPTLGEQLGRNGYAYVQAHCTPQAVACQYLALFRQVLSEYRDRS